MNNMVWCSSVSISGEAFCRLLCVSTWSQLRREQEYTAPITENLVKTEGCLCVSRQEQISLWVIASLCRTLPIPYQCLKLDKNCKALVTPSTAFYVNQKDMDNGQELRTAEQILLLSPWLFFFFGHHFSISWRRPVYYL